MSSQGSTFTGLVEGLAGSVRGWERTAAVGSATDVPTLLKSARRSSAPQAAAVETMVTPAAASFATTSRGFVRKPDPCAPTPAMCAARACHITNREPPISDPSSQLTREKAGGQRAEEREVESRGS